MDNSDILILLWSCPECVQLKMNFDFNKAFSDIPVGKNGNKLYLYYCFSNAGFLSLLMQYHIININKAPVLIKSDGSTITEIKDLIEYMKTNYS